MPGVPQVGGWQGGSGSDLEVALAQGRGMRRVGISGKTARSLQGAAALVVSLIMPSSSCPPWTLAQGWGLCSPREGAAKLCLAEPWTPHSRLLTSRATARLLPVPEVTQVPPMAALGYGKAHLGTGVTSSLPKHPGSRYCW